MSKLKKSLIVIVVCSVLIALLLYIRSERKDEAGTTPAIDTETQAEEDLSKTRTLAMAIDVPEDSTYGAIASMYRDKVNEMSKGSLTIEIYDDGLLGYSDDLLDSIAEDYNAADIILIPVSYLADAGSVKTGKLLEPYQFKGHSDFYKWSKTKEAEALLAEPQECGLGAEGLFFCEDGFNHLVLREELSDVKGRTIAGKLNPQSEAYIASLDATYEHMPSIEIKQAILDGVVDGADMNLADYEYDAMWESAPYIVNDYHGLEPCEAVIKLSALEKLSKKEKILKDAGHEVVKEYTKVLETADRDLIAKFKENGATTIKLR